MDHVVTTWPTEYLDAVVALLNRASAYAQFPLEQVREMLDGDEQAAPELRLAAWDRDTLTGAIVGTRRGEIAHVKLLAVAPEARRGGIASALLAELERRLAASGSTALRLFADAPYFLRPGVDVRDTPLVSFVERRGFRQTRAVCNMTVDLATAPLDTTADEARLSSVGLEVRRLRAADAVAFDGYLAERWSTSWRVEGMRALRRDPVSAHIALRDGRIVGFAAHSVSGPGQFGPMGTNPELRGQGIGAVLLRRCLADQRDAGLAECDIQWVGPKAFYADAVSALITSSYWQYAKPLGALS